MRCDPVLQQLVYKLVPGLYAKEMARRRKYYSELGGPSSDSDNAEYPIPDVYFSPSDCISLSLEFLSNKDGETGSDSDQESAEKQGLHHRRYLQCPAAVTMSHLKKFLRMKYNLSLDYNVEILYAGEVLTDEFSLMDVAYTFTWNKTTPMRFQFRLFQVPKVQRAKPSVKAVEPISPQKPKEVAQEKSKVIEEEVDCTPKQDHGLVSKPEENNLNHHEEDHDEGIQQVEEDEEDDEEEEEEVNQRLEEEEYDEGRNEELEDEEANERLEEEEAEQRMEDEEAMERLEEDEVNRRLEEEALIEEEAIEEIEDDEDVQIIPDEVPSRTEALPKKIERTNGLKRPLIVDKEKPSQEIEPKKAKRSPSPKLDSIKFKQDEKRFLEDMIIEEDTDEDRLRISASEGEKSPGPEPEVEKRVEEKPRSEERRREKKKSKKGKHHHHHRHHDRKRCDSPPTAQIVHSPENDRLKLKVKLTAIKSDNMVKGYSVVDGSESRKESRENGSVHRNSDRSTEKHEKHKFKDNDHKKTEPVSCNNNNNNNNNNHNNNNNNGNQVNNATLSSNTISEIARRAELTNERLMNIRAFRKALPKQNGTAKPPEPMKMPPSSITVSKITAAEKRQMEQQKLLMNRNQINGLDPKRPSLEIMLVNAPKKTEIEGAKPEVKKVIRPTPPSIPLSRLPKGMVGGPKTSPPPLRSVRPGPEEALDLSGKSSRKSPESLDSLMIPLLPKGPPSYAPARPCKPNPTVRQIPNPSALIYRQNPLNSRSMPPPVVPISSLRQMESMTKKIDKLAAGLTVKAAAAGFAAK